MEKRKIMIGMSGGVDSSVAAMLLKDAGYQVAGVTMILKPDEILTPEEISNKYKESDDAAAVCQKLGIPHYVKDFSEDFKDIVIDYFLNEYFSGRTPNPCIVCNQNFKFGRMLDFAIEMGYDAIATGHYAKIERDDKGRYLLKKADNRKDQSYFLYGFTQKQLARTVIPLNRMTKDEARALAEERGLPVAQKPDSQEICFIKNNNYISFIEKYAGRKAPEGCFVDESGSKLGTHSGIYKYTIGQRKGLGVTFGEPRYVTRINAEDNTVTLGREGSQYRDELTASGLNLISIESLDAPMEVTAKVRYQAKPAEALVTPLDNGRVHVKFKDPQRSVTPGQAVVFYDEDTVVGGAIIE